MSSYSKENKNKLIEFLTGKGYETAPFESEESAKPFFAKEHMFDVVELCDAGLDFQVEGSERLDKSTYAAGVMRSLSSIEKKLAGLDGSRGAQVKPNVILNIARSDDEWLHLVDQVDVVEDCCTDVLREKLDEGWRIIAVCPQPKNRRPDYVLGRAKEKEVQVQTVQPDHTGQISIERVGLAGSEIPF